MIKICLVGGFLGSGKTTAITAAGKMLLQEQLRVGIIMNDQGSKLVDAAFANSLQIPSSEVKNGCFCCNYEQFYFAINDLDSSIHPHIIFAEAVGSCTDLVATIVKPLLRSDFQIELTLSVFADGPVLLSSLEGRSSFVSDNIQYICKKQLKEAAIIIVNKADNLTSEEINKIQLALKTEYPDKKILFQDSKDENSVKKWLDVIREENSIHQFKPLDIDYEKYAKGEAALAWLDAFVKIHSKRKAIDKAFEFIEKMFEEISFQRLPIGHLKFFLQSGDWKQKVSYTANNRESVEKSSAFIADHVSIIVNARIETDPDQLKKIFFQAIRKIENGSCNIEIFDLDAFQPGYPKPTHRISE